MSEFIKKFVHLDEEDPEALRIAREILESVLGCIAETDPDVFDRIEAREAFLANLYGADVDGVDAIVEKYWDDANPILLIEFEHPEAGMVRTVVFVLRPGVDLRSMMNRQTGADIPEHLVN